MVSSETWAWVTRDPDACTLQFTRLQCKQAVHAQAGKHSLEVAPFHLLLLRPKDQVGDFGYVVAVMGR